MKEAPRFYSSLAMLIVLNLVIKPVWVLGIDRQVQNAVGTEEYGHYFSLYNFSLVMGFLLDWGLTIFLNRQMAYEKEKFIHKTGGLLVLKLLFAILYTAVVVLFCFITGVTRWDIVTGVIAIQILSFLFVFLRAIITAEQWFRTDSWLSVFDKTLMILLCGSLLLFPQVFGKINIHQFLRFQVISMLAAILLTFAILWRRGVKFSGSGLSSVWNTSLFLSALPYALVVLLMAAHARLDGFMLERIYPNGAQEAGIYAASYRLLDAANMIGVLFASFVLPFIARQWSRGEEISAVVLNIRHTLVIFSVVVSVIIVFMAPWIHTLLYAHSDAYASKVLEYCIPSLVGYTLVSVYGTVMTATGHIYPFCVITLGSVIINILLNVVLIPSQGAIGSCIAALISQLASGLATLYYTHKKLKVATGYRSLLIYTFTAAALCGYFLLLKNQSVHPLVRIAGAVLIAGIIVFTTKLFDISKWKNLLRTEDISSKK